ncbi:SDR family NAD(P)-dependent oxidoreductase [bacterium]|nr:MAG: SDR family NAD(P)-dependent oxidoreductase [bacterium]
MESLKKKTVLITGASAGIGEATAIAFAELGVRLILTARRKDKLDMLAKSLKEKFNTESLCMSLDVTRQKDVQKTIDSLPAAWSEIDILINNAGLGRGVDKIHEARIEDWEEMIDTNIKGLLYVSRAVIPGMVKRNSGHVINLGSAAGHEVYPGGNVYCATKHAVDALTKAMRMDLIETAVRVSTVDPGLVETDFGIVRFKGDTEKAKKPYENIQPLVGADIADIIIFIASRPAHVNINEVIVMPKAQASTTMVYRGKK